MNKYTKYGWIIIFLFLFGKTSNLSSIALGNIATLLFLHSQYGTAEWLLKSSQQNSYHDNFARILSNDLYREGKQLQAIDELNTILRQNPNNNFASYDLGKIYIENNNSKLGVLYWVNAGAAIPLYMKGVEFGKTQNWKDAIPFYYAAWTINPRLAGSSLAYAIYNGNQDAKSAEGIFRQLVSKYPDDANYYFWSLSLGNFLDIQKRWNESIAIYSNLIKEYPKNSGAYVAMGRSIYKKKLDLEIALNYIRTGIKLEPKHYEGYVAIADIYRIRNNLTEADFWYAQAIDYDKNDPWPFIARCEILIQTKNTEKAIQLAENGIKIFPDNDQLWYLLSQAYEQSNNFESALFSIHNAVKIKNQNLVYLFLLGGIYEKLNNKVEAISTYNDIINIDPQNQQAMNAINRCNR
jgi:tetratricopeptide (TPR) repeat protein